MRYTYDKKYFLLRLTVHWIAYVLSLTLPRGGVGTLRMLSCQYKVCSFIDMTSWPLQKLG